jgi:preprotein translocase subunit SecE
VARNRKRAKERRARRPAAAARTARGVATAGVERTDAVPESIEHATPDVELAEAQLALGRPELAGPPEGEPSLVEDQTAMQLGEPEEELYFEAEQAEREEHDRTQPDPDGELVPRPAGSPEHRLRTGPRLVNFLQGSWRELQRVQWPDRRAVMQATGVVIGFVIIAGLYLGLADQVASKIVTFILK